jgi:hypothetical protein
MGTGRENTPTREDIPPVCAVAYERPPGMGGETMRCAVRERKRKINRPGRWPKEVEIIHGKNRMAREAAARDRRF